MSAGLTCFKLLARRRRAVCVVVMGEPGAAEALEIGAGIEAGPRGSVPIRAGEAWAIGRALETRKKSRKTPSPS